MLLKIRLHKSISIVALLRYIDDIIIWSPNIATIDKIKVYLHSQFKIKNLETIKYFLGLEIARSN